AAGKRRTRRARRGRQLHADRRHRSAGRSRLRDRLLARHVPLVLDWRIAPRHRGRDVGDCEGRVAQMTAVLVGMLGPLAAVGGSWPLRVRTFRANPEKLTSVMMSAFAMKMGFFAVYVSLAIAVFRLPAVPFTASFTTAFITLYAIEAFGLRRLLA